MNPTFLIYSLTLWSLTLAYQVNERESIPPKLPLRPGDLLKSLDELTSDAQEIYSPPHEAPQQTANRRVYHDDGTDSDSEYDYDKAYEDFVSKYFAQGEEDLDSENEDERSEDIDTAVPYESQNEADEVDEPRPKKKSSKSKRCERVEIDDQNCLVCEDPKTNEKSKSCSYSSESKPKSYGFSRERSTKSSKDDDDYDESAEVGRSLKREVNPKKDKIQPRRTSIKAFLTPGPEDVDGIAKCTRKREDGMICFYCGTAADNIRECMADKNHPKKRRLDETSKKDSTTKKVFKRMITYSFKNDEKPQVKQNIYAALKGY